VLCKESDFGSFKPLVEGLLVHADRLADTQHLKVTIAGQLVREARLIFSVAEISAK
jgi:hypothetical protein